MAYTCIAPHCAKDCSGCVSAIAPDDEPRQIILALLTEFAGATSLDDGEHTVIDRARAYLRIPAAALSAPTEQVPAGLLEWAVQQWRSEVEHRPLVNKNRRPLDDVWRQVIRFAGGDPEALVGPSHDELLAASPSAPTAVQPADDALTPTERAACQQCGSNPHKMSCSAGGKTQLRLTADATPTAVKEAGGVDASKRYIKDLEDTLNTLSSILGSPRNNADALISAAVRAAQPATPVAPIPLKRGVTGRCSRTHCVCVIEGLGDECVWLEPIAASPRADALVGLTDDDSYTLVGLAEIGILDGKQDLPAFCYDLAARLFEARGKQAEAKRARAIAAKNNMTLGGE